MLCFTIGLLSVSGLCAGREIVVGYCHWIKMSPRRDKTLQK